MKILLFLCTIWSVLYLNLSLTIVDHNVGTIGKSGYPYPHRYYLYCDTRYCEIEDVEATLSNGEMNLTGLYIGSYGRTSTFCEGQPKNVTTGIKKCKILKMFWLKEAQIKLDALEEIGSVNLRVTGRNLYKIDIDPRQPLEEIDYNVGTLGTVGVTFYSLYYIYCQGPCDIVDVKAELRDGDDLSLTGYYGNGVNLKFCKELPNDSTGIEKCHMLKKHGLSKARIKINFNKIIRDVKLRVRGYNLHKISTEQPSQYERDYNVGTLEKNDEHVYYIYCNGPCDLEEILVDKEDHRFRYLQLKGYYGNDYDTDFCQDVVQAHGLEKCIIQKNTWHSTALVILKALRKQHGVRIIVRGYNVIKIVDQPEHMKIITKDIGTIKKNQYMKFDLTCTGQGGSCALHLIEAKFRGDVRYSGPHQNWVYSKNPTTYQGWYMKECPSRINQASLILFGNTESQEVTLTVKGHYLKSVDLEKTWSA